MSDTKTHFQLEVSVQESAALTLLIKIVFGIRHNYNYIQLFHFLIIVSMLVINYDENV